VPTSKCGCPQQYIASQRGTPNWPLSPSVERPLSFALTGCFWPNSAEEERLDGALAPVIYAGGVVRSKRIRFSGAPGIRRCGSGGGGSMRNNAAHLLALTAWSLLLRIGFQTRPPRDALRPIQAFWTHAAAGETSHDCRDGL